MDTVFYISDESQAPGETVRSFSGRPEKQITRLHALS